MNLLKLKRAIETFFIEDIGDQDLTSDLLFPKDTEGTVYFHAKQEGVLCGTEVIRFGYELLDSSIHVETLIKDGNVVSPGETIARVSGNLAILLKGERVILNLLQRMSGIATLTNEAVSQLNSNHTKVCDTRKTTPGLRMFEKYAITVGGGYNHRNGLYDAVMIKDNHIAFAGSIRNAVHLLRTQLGHMVKIEVETENKQQILEAVEAKVDCIMIDNCSIKKIKDFVKLIPSSITTEVSGGISISRLAEYTNLGVDYISLGCLTHSAPSLDISVNVDLNQVTYNHTKEEIK